MKQVVTGKKYLEYFQRERSKNLHVMSELRSSKSLGEIYIKLETTGE